MKTTCTFKSFMALLILLLNFNLMAQDHLIYSIDEEVPMGFDNEINKRNYYLNIGGEQGVSKGTVIDVYRTISKLNPYNDQKRINHKIKIGELKVIHSEGQSSIGRIEKILLDEDTPLFEIESFMIGDHVSVNVN